MPRTLEPVEEPFSAEVAAVLETYPKRDGYVLQLFRVFANSLRFLKKGTVNLLDRSSPVTLRQREIVILRTCANNDCEYEWGVHIAAFAGHVGLDDRQVASTRLGGHADPCWTDEERVLLCAVDELCAGARIEPVTYRAIRHRFSLEQQLEILALCGNYHTVCFVANTARLELESFGARFPRP
jgi:alkylhydroperoxidase family enzyme